jgi:thiamine-phosphate pyrophosphorylase
MRSDLLNDIPIYLVTDATPSSGPIEDYLGAVIAAGVGMVQLRDRTLGDRALVETARRFADACRRSGALFIVNDRVDVALSSGADGVHVGQTDLHPDEIRRIAGGDFIIGLSTHSASEIDAAELSAADYIGVGPVHETPTKPGRRPVGLDLVRYAASAYRKPFFAIGGIDAGNAADVIAAGARAVAVVRAVTQSADPDGAVRNILQAMGPRPTTAP